jgi:hypothetical protein
MARTALVSAAAVAAAATLTAGIAWAGGPPGVVDDSPGPPGSYGGMFAAVGSGTFVDPSNQDSVEVGYNAYGNTEAEAESSLIGQCVADGGQNCSADMVTNDNLCIAVVVDINTRVDVGGAGPTVEAARLNAVDRAAANGTPVSPDSPVLISDCP